MFISFQSLSQLWLSKLFFDLTYLKCFQIAIRVNHSLYVSRRKIPVVAYTTLGPNTGIKSLEYRLSFRR